MANPIIHSVKGKDFWIETKELGLHLWDARYCVVEPWHTCGVSAIMEAWLAERLYRLSEFGYARTDAVFAAEAGMKIIASNGRPNRTWNIGDWG